MSGKYGKYGLIYCDCPWQYRDQARAGQRGAAFKYPVMGVEDLVRLDVGALAARECVLAMWATFPMLAEALDVMRAWGFRYSTVGFCWVKTAPDGARVRARRVLRDSWIFGEPGADDSDGERRRRDYLRDVIEALGDAGALHPGLAWGMGMSTRANVEPVLLGYRGRLGRVSAGVHQVVMAPPGRHSAKPALVRDRLVQLLGDRRRVELFARERVEGWDAWGNEVPGGSDVELRMRPEAGDADGAHADDAAQADRRQTTLFELLETA